MSQEGLVDILGVYPIIPTTFDADVGTAMPIANILEVLGEVIAAAATPFQSVASGNTVTYQVQFASAAAATDATAVGLAAFDSAYFTVDANGFVSFLSSSFTEIGVDAHTAPGTDPVTPLSAVITMTGAQVAAGTVGTNVIRTNSLAANTVTIEIQRSSAQATTTIDANGVAHFDSAAFDVDANGFVQLNGGGIATTQYAPNSGTNPVVPTAAGLINIVGTGSTTVVGSLNTVTIELTGLTNHNVLVGAGTATVTNVAPSATSGVPLISNGASADPSFGTAVVAGGGTGATSFTAYAPVCGGTTSTNPLQSASTGLSTSGFVLTSNGASALPSFQSVSASGAITTITGNTGGAESPSSGNFNIVGTGSITVAGSANTETVQLTGLTNHSLLVGAGTATITNLGVATNGQLPIGSTGADPVLATITASTGVSITNGAGSITIAATGAGMATVEVTGTSQSMAVDTFYIANNAALVTLTLPTTSALGSVIEIAGKGAGGWKIAQNSGQQIYIGSIATTSGVGGSLASSNFADTIKIRCITADILWTVIGAPVGNITYV